MIDAGDQDLSSSARPSERHLTVISDPEAQIRLMSYQLSRSHQAKVEQGGGF